MACCWTPSRVRALSRAALLAAVLAPVSLAVRQENALGANESAEAAGRLGKPARVKVEIINDTPYDIADLIIMHKFFGNDKGRYARVEEVWYHDLAAQALSPPLKVTTGVGAWVWREDWWFLTWRFKPTASGACPWRAKDGQCESWITNPKNQFGALWVDPTTYVKIAAGVANVAVTAASMGTATIVAVGAGGLAVELTTAGVLADERVDGFKACGINEIDYVNSENRDQPIRVRIFREFEEGQLVTWHGPRHEEISEGGVGSVVETKGTQFVIVEFKQKRFELRVSDLRHTFQPGHSVTLRAGPNKGKQGEVLGADAGLLLVKFEHRKTNRVCKPEQLTGKEPTHRYGVEWLLFEKDAPVPAPRHFSAWWRKKFVRWECDTHGLAMADSSDVATLAEGEQVKLKIINRSGRRIRQWSVMHKFNGLDHPIHIVDSSASLEQGAYSAGADHSIRTETGPTVFRNDWWTMAWQYDDENCTANAMLQDDLVKDILADPESILTSVGLAATGLILGLDVGIRALALPLGMAQADKFSERDRYENSKASFQLFGAKLMDLLMRGSSAKGFVKCNLDRAFVRQERPVEIAIYPDKVIFDLGGGDTCEGPVSSLGCVHRPDCTEACQYWAQGADKAGSAEPPEGAAAASMLAVPA